MLDSILANASSGNEGDSAPKRELVARVRVGPSGVVQHIYLLRLLIHIQLPRSELARCRKWFRGILEAHQQGLPRIVLATGSGTEIPKMSFQPLPRMRQ